MDKKLVLVVKTRIEPDRFQDRLPQNEPFWHVDYFKLKITKTQKTQEEFLPFPLVPVSSITRDK